MLPARWRTEHTLPPPLFLPCLPSVLPAASKAPPHPFQSVCSRPLRQGWDQSARFPGFAAAPLLVLCLASPSRRQVFRRFHNVNASTDCSTTAFDHNRVQPRLAQPTPWVSNPSRYPAVTREAALSRSAARHFSVRGGGAALFAAAPAIFCFAAALSATPAILFRAKALFCSGAVALQ